MSLKRMHFHRDTIWGFHTCPLLEGCKTSPKFWEGENPPASTSALKAVKFVCPRCKATYYAHTEATHEPFCSGTPYRPPHRHRFMCDAGEDAACELHMALTPVPFKPDPNACAHPETEISWHTSDGYHHTRVRCTTCGGSSPVISQQGGCFGHNKGKCFGCGAP